MDPSPPRATLSSSSAASDVYKRQPYVRSPSPQRRYHTEEVDHGKHRVADPLDHGYHQSQKRLQESHLEEQRSSLTYELETLRAQMAKMQKKCDAAVSKACLLYTSPSPRDRTRSRRPSSA
eukprot:TRINITY_DN26056_c0_g1_i1.p2 TRINITY_DN26056_c0_g1~~TRINITY_DN26056_c0_g1_i1.p2  ORF type:complete len:121 (-),score=27.23 TRINITY_DN26056_c0_g1_i1:25-387(-)